MARPDGDDKQDEKPEDKKDKDEVRPARPNLRQRLYLQLDSEAQGEGISLLNKAIAAAVVISAIDAALLTEPRAEPFHFVLLIVQFACASLFTLEFLARLWVKFENPRWRHHPLGPFGWVTRWYAAIDLFVVVGVWLELALGAGFGAIVMLRLLRVLRVFMAGGDSEFGRAGREIVRAVRERRLELTVAAAVAGLVLMGASVAMYWAERDVQPVKFGSIPRAMWWSVVTLTTVGYGDVVPQTPIGKLIAGVTALFSVALVALPAGIMAAAFSEALSRIRHRHDGQ